MNYLERLLQGADVEYMLLGDIESAGFIELGRGKVISKKAMRDFPGDYPVYSSSSIGNGEIGRYGDYMFDDERITWSIDGGGKFFYRNNLRYSVTNVGGWLKVLRTDVLSAKYLYYALSNEWAKKIFNYIQKAHPSVIRKEYIIPIPPLSVQSEIVRVLDTFTELTTELTTEFTMREQQYEYYREQLLTFEKDKVEWKTIDEVFSLRNGYTPSKSKPEYWSNGTIPWFRMDDIRENGRVLNSSIQYVNSVALRGRDPFPPNSLIIATSATIGEHALIAVPFLCNQRFTCLTLQEAFLGKLDMKYLFYYSFILGEWCQKNTTISNFPSVDMNRFRKFLIPIPPMEEQERIVGILDKFDTLTMSITEGLPREIELRQKQYEYYRDMLLSFPKAKK